MYALVYNNQVDFVSDYPMPQRKPKEAIIKPTFMGICNTDIEITKGYKSFQGVLGHEFVGTIDDCEDVNILGTRVVGEINIACNTCKLCEDGQKKHCLRRKTLGINDKDGVFAEYFSIPIENLHVVPKNVPNRYAVFSEPIAASLEVLELSHVRPSEKVAVIGDGKLGILLAQVLRLSGSDVFMIGRHPERWKWLNSLGIKTSDGKNLKESSFDFVSDCSGNPRGLDLAHYLTKPRGRVSIKSTFAGNSEVNLTKFVVDEITLITSRCGCFPAALRLLENKLLDLDPMIEETYSFMESKEALEHAKGKLKVLISGL